MSTIKHLRKASNILYNNFDIQIIRDGDWTYNLKNWTINFIVEPDYESTTAYRVIDGKTNWSDYIILEKRIKEWKELV